MQRIINTPNRRFWLIAAGILLAAFIFYTRLWAQAPFAATDTNPYLDVARDLTDFRLDEFHVRAPGYPWLIMLTGSAQVPNRLLFIVQLGMYFGVVAFLLGLLRRMAVRASLLWVFLFIALLPYNVMPAAKVLTETFSQFLLVFGLGLFLLWLEKGRWYWLGLAAFFLAVLGISRPTFQIFSIVLSVALIALVVLLPSMRRRLLIGAGGLVLLAALIVGGLGLHNLQSHGYFGTTPLFGLNLTQKTARVLELLPEEYAVTRDVLIKYRDQSLLSYQDSHQFYNYIWEVPVQELAPRKGMSYAQISSYYLGMNLYLIGQAPLIYIQEVGYSLSNYVLPATNTLSHFSSLPLQAAWTLTHYVTLAFFLLALVIFIAACMWYLAKTKAQRQADRKAFKAGQHLVTLFVFFASLAIFYNLLITILVEMGEPRSRLSTEPLIIALCVIGLELWFRFRTRIQRSAPIN